MEFLSGYLAIRNYTNENILISILVCLCNKVPVIAKRGNTKLYSICEFYSKR